MIEDNTPIVTAKKRKPTTKLRLRLETVKRLQTLTSQNQQKQKQKQQAPPSQGADESTPTKEPTEAALQPRAPRVKKNMLQKPAKPKAKFRKRQIFKSWLPTHLFHAKRAHMTPAKEPLWRMAIAISPTAKSYRPTHRASTARGAVAWDMSYISTIGLEGPEKSIKGLLRALGVKGAEINDCADDVTTRWTKGVRSWEGWVYERDSKPSKAIAPVTIIWCAEASVPDEMEVDDARRTTKTHRVARKMFIRVHPAGFLQLWEEVLRLGKVQKPAVMVEDLRFEIGSIEISGPCATEALVGALWPCPTDSETDSSQKVSREAWPMLRNLTNPASLPRSVVLGFEITDPRLHHPSRKSSTQTSEEAHQKLLQTLAAWPPDKTYGSAKIFDRTARFVACKRLPSQKAISRRKALATPGQFPQAQAGDPAIPVLLFVTRSAGSNNGNWTVLMPWKCVLPVWYSIMYCPLTSGGTSRFGGLDEKRQIAFESGTPWFPGDYPGLPAGMAWEQQERGKRKTAWERRPKGKRIEWESLNLGHDCKGEVGLGWACDWQELLKQNSVRGEPEAAETQPLHIDASKASALLSTLKLAEPIGVSSTRSLATVKLNMLSRGVVSTCARIYRLPTNNPNLRQKWLNLQPSILKTHATKEARSKLVLKDVPPHVRRQHLAASLLQAPPTPRVGEDNYPVVPDKEDLMGFVTTGNFNLGEGKGTGIGSLLMKKLLDDEASGVAGNKAANGEERRLCIVREAGQAIGRLARWTLV